MSLNHNQVTESIIGAAIEVHRSLGPGLLESAYSACLAFELAERGLKVEIEKPLPIVYRGVQLECGYRIDLLVNDLVIVEVKSVEKLIPIHEAQILSYLRLSNLNLGLLINFNVGLLTHGVRRIAHNLPE